MSLAVLATRLGYRLILRTMRAPACWSPMRIVGAAAGPDLCRPFAGNWSVPVVGSSTTAAPGRSPPGARGVGSTTDLRAAVATHAAQSVLVAGGSVATETTERVYRDLQELPVDLHLSTGVLGVAASRVAVQRFDDVPVLGLRRAELSRCQALLKRLFDVVVAGLLFLCLSPVLLGCALAVRLSGPGPIQFRQRRFGKDGEVIWVHKFRSMTVGAEERQPMLRVAGNDADGPLFKLHRDPRVTRSGACCRLEPDELPQLFDVLRGHMSLVGPRPSSPPRWT